MDLDRMSSNLIEIINGILRNQVLVNFIGFDGDNPEIQTINPSTIAPKGINERILPYPFNTNFTGKVQSSVHVYYPSLEFVNNGNANQVVVLFDVVVHKSIWLFSNKGKKLIRPYEIVNLIVNTFKKTKIGTLGEINFIDGNHLIVNDEFEGFRLVANITEF